MYLSACCISMCKLGLSPSSKSIISEKIPVLSQEIKIFLKAYIINMKSVPSSLQREKRLFLKHSNSGLLRCRWENDVFRREKKKDIFHHERKKKKKSRVFMIATNSGNHLSTKSLSMLLQLSEMKRSFRSVVFPIKCFYS